MIIAPFNIQLTPDNTNPSLILTQTKNRFPLDFLHTCTVIFPSVTQNLDTSSLPLTRSNFCLPSDHFYIKILTAINRPCLSARKVKKKTVYWSPKHWKSKQEFFESIPCFYFFVTLVQIQWPSQDINQVSLLNSFFKILIYISCSL